MQNILAIETSTAECSVALQTASGLCYARSRSGSTIHSQVVLPLVHELLEAAGLHLTDVTAIGVCRGPGSFTGLRIGIGVAQGMAFGAGLPMFGFSSLDVLVNQQTDLSALLEAQPPKLSGHARANTTLVLAALDARMQEVYWASYLLDASETASHEQPLLSVAQVAKPSELTLPNDDSIACAIANGQVRLLGNAWSVYPELLTQLNLPTTAIPNPDVAILNFPSAMGLIKLYEQTDDKSVLLESASDFAPLYVRNNVAAKPKPSVHTGANVL